jgi:hypothetical protein
VTLRKHGRRRKNLHSIEDIGTGTAPAAVSGRDWTLEFQTKKWCAHCRNYRTPKHVAQHAAIIAGGKRPRDFRL